MRPRIAFLTVADSLSKKREPSKSTSITRRYLVTSPRYGRYRFYIDLRDKMTSIRYAISTYFRNVLRRIDVDSMTHFSLGRLRRQAHVSSSAHQNDAVLEITKASVLLFRSFSVFRHFRQNGDDLL